MPHPNTLRLIDKYGDKFVNNTLEDGDINKLDEVSSKEFPPQPNYINEAENYTSTKLMQDFIQTIGPSIPEGFFREITQKFLNAGQSAQDKTTFMRNTSMEKILLAYSIARGYESLFEVQPLNEFTPMKKYQIERVILGPSIKLFKDKIDEVIPWHQLQEMTKLFMDIDKSIDELPPEQKQTGMEIKNQTAQIINPQNNRDQQVSIKKYLDFGQQLLNSSFKTIYVKLVSLMNNLVESVIKLHENISDKMTNSGKMKYLKENFDPLFDNTDDENDNYDINTPKR